MNEATPNCLLLLRLIDDGPYEPSFSNKGCERKGARKYQRNHSWDAPSHLGGEMNRSEHIKGIGVTVNIWNPGDLFFE